MQTSDRIRRIVRALGVERLEEDHTKPELSAVQRLASELDAEVHVPYPPPCASGTCDLVVPERGASTWIEVKLASAYRSPARPGVPGVPLRRQLTGSAPGSALSDVRDRLATLIGRDAGDWIGFLLIVFHSRALPLRDADLEQLELAGGLQEVPWSRAVDEEWVDPSNDECRIRACYWERPA